jgi:hypothetical protein
VENSGRRASRASRDGLCPWTERKTKWKIKSNINIIFFKNKNKSSVEFFVVSQHHRHHAKQAMQQRANAKAPQH